MVVEIHPQFWMKKTRGKSFSQELSTKVLEAVTHQCAQALNMDYTLLLANPSTVVSSINEKKVEISWDLVSGITGIPKRKCYKHFNETIAPKVTSSGFLHEDEQFIIDQMHAAIDRGSRLDIDLLEKFIKPQLGDRYLKVALLRKYNNLKRTKEIVQHMEEAETEQKRCQRVVIQQQFTARHEQEAQNAAISVKKEAKSYRIENPASQQDNYIRSHEPFQPFSHLATLLINRMSTEEPEPRRQNYISSQYLMSKTEDGEDRKLVLLASALQNDLGEDDM